MSLEILDILSIGACVIGITLFLITIFNVRQILNLFPKHSGLRKNWILKLTLLILFIVGYVINIAAILTDNTDIILSMQAIVYIIGAFFVWFVARVSLTTYKAILEEK